MSVVDPTGVRTAWIDVGSPSAERLHKASKATARVAVFTHLDVEVLRREVEKRPVHRAAEIAVWRIEPAWLAAMEDRLDRSARFELVRSEGELYATVGGESVRGAIHQATLQPPV